MPIVFDPLSLNYQPDYHGLIHALRSVLPADRLLLEVSETMVYECDALSAYRERPMAVILPENEEEVCACLKICYRYRCPVVSRGGGTSLSGGSMPHPQGIVMSLARMNAICHIDPLSRIARVESGVRNLAISEAVAPYSLYYAPDPSSQLACTIGGNVAENAGGVHCLKYGLTVHNVLGISGFTITGEYVSIDMTGLELPGPDLLAFVHGSEGQLLVITQVTLRLLPKPHHVKVLLAAFDSVSDAGEAVAAIIGAGIIPAGLELMDQATIKAVEPFIKADYPLDAAALLICESDGLRVEVEEEIETLRQIMQQYHAIHLRISRNETERQKIWSGRKNAFPAVGRMTPDYYCIDGSIPRRHIANMLQSIAHMEKQFGLRCINVFHAGDGNLHPLICYDSSKPGELEQAEAFGSAILEKSITLGGSITGEHGVGIEKINQMCVQFGTDELDIFNSLRHVFDPHQLLNPGKAIPTLHRCAEFGTMHVHKGELPHPEIPRF